MTVTSLCSKEEMREARFNKDVRSWIRKCDVCARPKSPSTQSRDKMQQIGVGHRGQQVVIDVLGPLPQSRTTSRVVMDVGDCTCLKPCWTCFRTGAGSAPKFLIIWRNISVEFLL